MGIQTTTRITCDYPECKSGQNGPLVVSWINEEIKAGKPVPPESAELVLFEMNGAKLAFCGRLDAAKFFLPSGYEVTMKKVIEFPNNGTANEAQ